MAEDFDNWSMKSRENEADKDWMVLVWAGCDKQ